MPKVCLKKNFKNKKNIKNELENKTIEKSNLNEKKDDENQDNLESDKQSKFSKKNNLIRVNVYPGFILQEEMYFY